MKVSKIIIGISFGFGGCVWAQKSPNIILINIDDYGWTDMSSNGSTYYETPNIDALREKGIWFTNAYAGCANSAPSRACLLTGKYPPRHGIYTVGNSDRGEAIHRRLIPIPNSTSLKPGTVTLPQVLKEAGYQTCHVGKWHVTDDPSKSGVDVNIGGNHAGHPRSYFAPYKNPNLKDGPDGEYLPDRLGNEAVNYLRNVSKDRPFFMYYATYSVHTPLQARKELIEKYKNKPKTKTHDNPVYAAMVEAMDRNVGNVLKEVETLGLSENTLIVFISDNGGLYKVSRQWPLRAGKGSFYEGGIRTPMIIYQKGKFEHNEIHDVPVLQFDLFPTILDLIGEKRSDLKLDGKSLLPLLSGKTKSYKKRPIFWHFPAYLEGSGRDVEETGNPYFRTCPVSVVRLGDWKLIQNYETEKVELYNLKEDISERNDLSDIETEKRDELFKVLQKWKKEVNAPVPYRLNLKYEPE